jgi:DNA-binding HxlR family transcriptional regulator
MPRQPIRFVSGEAEDCATADATLVRAFDVLGKRWTGVLLGTLRDGSVGFRALSRAIPGISDSVLSDRLRDLTDAALITRRVADGPPVSVSYSLSEAGLALLPALAQIREWAAHHLPDPALPPGPDAGGKGQTARRR